jgi:hypothetical protein
MPADQGLGGGERVKGWKRWERLKRMVRAGRLMVEVWVKPGPMVVVVLWVLFKRPKPESRGCQER